MQVGGVSLDLTLIMHEQALGDYLTDHSFLSLESVGGEQARQTPIQEEHPSVNENDDYEVVMHRIIDNGFEYLIVCKKIEDDPGEWTPRSQCPSHLVRGYNNKLRDQRSR